MWLLVAGLVLFGCWKGSWVVNRALYPDLYRGLDIIDAVHTPGSWQASYGPRSPHTSHYHPANSGKPPFKMPYNWWTRRYWAHDWSLADSVRTYDAGARNAGWKPTTCPIARDPDLTTARTCYKRPNFLLVVDVQSTGDCDPSTHNCGTTIKVELDERTVD